ncbi:hypothetical protein M1146_05450, partial [Patescibacteria group bacterium]|nr:hypothetical protein [Patescibacteria group bacterium]
MKSEVTKSADSTISIKITVPWKDVEKAREAVVSELTKKVSMPGFRKGQAPKKIAQEKLDKAKVQEEVLRKILPEGYVEAVKSNKLNPIINPRIHVEAFEDGTDLVFTAETCEDPEVNLNNYKEEVKKVTAKSKIIVPGKEEKKPNLDEIIDAVLKVAEIKICKMLIEQEVNRLLSQFIDELKTLGLTIDQFLQSRGKTGEDLRKEYEEKAEKDLKLEFLLRKIADTENVTVEQKDIDEVLSSIKDEHQRNELAHLM